MKKKLVKVDKQENKGGRTQKQHGSQQKRVILGVKSSTLLSFGLTTTKKLLVDFSILTVVFFFG